MWSTLIITRGWAWVTALFAGRALAKAALPLAVVGGVIAAAAGGWYLRDQLCDAREYKGQVAYLKEQMSKRDKELRIATRAHEADNKLAEELEAVNRRNMEIINDATPNGPNGGKCLSATMVNRLRRITR